jgi:DNA-binding PadR family transcriptional regulator
MKPLNYAILKHYTKADEACANDVIDALKGEYGHFKSLKKPSVVESLMTAEANGILEETRYDLDEEGRLRVYYRASESGLASINKYIRD